MDTRWANALTEQSWATSLGMEPDAHSFRLLRIRAKTASADMVFTICSGFHPAETKLRSPKAGGGSPQERGRTFHVADQQAWPWLWPSRPPLLLQGSRPHSACGQGSPLAGPRQAHLKNSARGLFDRVGYLACRRDGPGERGVPPERAGWVGAHHGRPRFQGRVAAQRMRDTGEGEPDGTLEQQATSLLPNALDGPNGTTKPGSPSRRET
jgi:hypothetical protein